MTAQITTVLLADDHPPTRRAVREALEAGSFRVCCEAHDTPSAVAMAQEHGPDVALLDIDMPGNGIAAAREIAALVPGTAIVMLTVSRDDGDLFDALRAGASGYLLKGMDAERLPLALRGVLDGEAALPRTLVAKVIEEFRGRDERTLQLRSTHQRVRLTSREWEILELLREGLTTRQIAGRLFVEPVTVRSHIHTILRKLKVPDRASAIQLLDSD